MQEVIARGVVTLAAVVVREVVTEWRARELIGEQVDLVQEQNLQERHVMTGKARGTGRGTYNRGFGKPP